MIVEVVTKSGRVMEVHSFHKNHITIGRGYSNDLILQDPYMDAEHLDVYFDRDSSEFTVRDMQSLNGTVLQKGHRHLNSHEPVVVASGQQMMLGKTTIRLLDKRHRIAPAQQLSPLEPLFAVLSAWWVTILAVLGCATLTLLTAYIQDPFTDQLMKELKQVVAMIVVAICYSGVWMLIARLQRIEGHFFLHTNLFLVAMILDESMQLCMPVFDYNFGWIIPSVLFSMAFSYVLILLMVFVSTQQATHLPNWASGSVAGVLAFLMIMSDLFKWMFPPEFMSAPSYNMTLVPPAYQIRHVVSEIDFIEQADSAFAEARKELE